MMPRLTFSRDEAGRPRAVGVVSDRLLLLLLESDLQEDVAVTDQFLQVLQDASGVGEFVGNAHSVTWQDRQATVSSLFDPDTPPLSLPCEELVALVRSWRKLIC